MVKDLADVLNVADLAKSYVIHAKEMVSVTLVMELGG